MSSGRPILLLSSAFCFYFFTICLSCSRCRRISCTLAESSVTGPVAPAVVLLAVEDVEPGVLLDVEPVVPEVVPEVVPVVVPDVPDVVPDAEELVRDASFRIRSIAAMCISGSPVLCVAPEVLCEPYAPVLPVVAPVVVDPDVVPVIVEPVVEPVVVEPVELIAPEADPLAEAWKASRCVRNSSSFVRTAGSSVMVPLVVPLVPTAPGVDEVVELDALAEPDADALSSMVSVVLTSLYADSQSSCVVIS